MPRKAPGAYKTAGFQGPTTGQYCLFSSIMGLGNLNFTTSSGNSDANGPQTTVEGGGKISGA